MLLPHWAGFRLPFLSQAKSYASVKHNRMLAGDSIERAAAPNSLNTCSIVTSWLGNFDDELHICVTRSPS